MLPSTEGDGVRRLCCLMPLSTIFQLIMVVSFIDWRNLVKTTDLPQVTDKLYHICCIEYQEKTTDLPQVTDKRYHICCIEYQEKTTDLPQVTDKLYHICCIEYTSQLLGFEHATLGVIGTDCTGYCKSN
jgi:ribosomal protein L30E